MPVDPTVVEWAPLARRRPGADTKLRTVHFMFESLSARLQGVIERLRGKAKITEADLDAALREIRLALLEADVNFRVVKEFVARVRERALGARC